MNAYEELKEYDPSGCKNVPIELATLCCMLDAIPSKPYRDVLINNVKEWLERDAQKENQTS